MLRPKSSLVHASDKIGGIKYNKDDKCHQDKYTNVILPILICLQTLISTGGGGGESSSSIGKWQILCGGTFSWPETSL